MIYVTQGHEKGVGLEIYFKSLLCLPQSKCEQFKLIAFKRSIEETLKTLQIDFNISHNKFFIGNRSFHYQEPDNNLSSYPQSSSTLLTALQKITEDDLLLTLPTSKDQLIFENKQFNGYTEFLRNYFNSPHLTMAFVSPSMVSALVSDHIPINELSPLLGPNYITAKITNAINTLQKIVTFNRVLISGINPHAGEGGLIGHEDTNVASAIKALTRLFQDYQFNGPFPGDTMHFSHKSTEDFLIFMYHDQGLSLFKAMNGLIGTNITCGLPFIRASVDHGTAFNLFGKNQANYQGCLYTMELLANAPHSRGQ